MRGSMIAGLFLAAAGSVAIAADSVPMMAGRWVETITATTVHINGRDVDAQAAGIKPEVKHRCMSPAEAAEPRLYFATVKPGDACSAPTGTVEGGKMSLSSHCVASDKKTMLSSIAVSGDYAAQSYKVAAEMNTREGGQPAMIQMVITGAYEGPCKGDED